MGGITVGGSPPHVVPLGFTRFQSLQDDGILVIAERAPSRCAPTTLLRTHAMPHPGTANPDLGSDAL